MRARVCLLHVAALMLAGVNTSYAQISGRVLDAQSTAGVAGATIWIIGAGTQYSTQTTDNGSYALRDVAPAEYTLLVVHPGYDQVRLRVTLRAGSSLTVDLPLEPRPVLLPQVWVHGQRGVQMAGTDTAAGQPAVNAHVDAHLERIRPQTAGALGDLVLATGTREPPPDAPGSRRPHVLYIWGSSAERGRVLLDGATVNAPLHLGGILPALDPDLLERAELRTGGVSARHDGGTTYIMDFGTRSPSSPIFRSRAEIDLLAARAWLEAPVSNSSGVLVGVRRVNHELVQNVLERPFGYGYTDALVRMESGAGAGGRLSATFFTTHEAVRLPRDQDVDDAGWDNLAASLRWRSSEDAAATRAGVSFSRGLAELPLLTALEGYLRAALDRYAASAERGFTLRDGSLHGGVDIEHLRFARRSGAAEDPALREPNGPVSCTVSLPCAEASITRLSIHGDATWQPARRLSARAGLRASYSPASASPSLLPRLALSVVNDAGTTSATLSAGRFSQVTTNDGPSPALSLAATPARVARLEPAITHATQLELQVTRRSANATLAASAFLRHHERSPRLAPLTVPGVEVSFGYTAGSSTLGIGYSVFGRRPAATGASAEYQHLAAASVSRTYGRFTAALATAYGDGLPLTSIVLERPVTTTGPLPGEGPSEVYDRSYFRVDALLSGEWAISAGGRMVHLVPYAKLVNGLSRREALFYFQDGTTPGQPEPVAALAALPVIGLRVSFW